MIDLTSYFLLFLASCKRVNLKACTNSSEGCPKRDAQRERKKPSHVQGHVNQAEEFWEGVQSIYLSFVGSGQVGQIGSRGTIRCAGMIVKPILIESTNVGFS